MTHALFVYYTIPYRVLLHCPGGHVISKTVLYNCILFLVGTISFNNKPGSYTCININKNIWRDKDDESVEILCEIIWFNDYFLYMCNGRVESTPKQKRSFWFIQSCLCFFGEGGSGVYRLFPLLLSHSHSHGII